MTTVSLYVELKAKAGKEEDVARFLAGARDLVAAEPGTIAWFAARFDKNTSRSSTPSTTRPAEKLILEGRSLQL
jgi:hypothetical protein